MFWVTALLFGKPALANTTLTLTGDPNQIYTVNSGTINVGPYPATIGAVSGLLVFCLDEGLTASFGGSGYEGTTHLPNTQAEEEAAFLAAYSLFKGATGTGLDSANTVNNVEGPISMAIWQIMGQLGGQKPDPKAVQFIQIAQSAFNNHLIPQAFLNSVTVFVPTLSGTIQPFMTAVRNDAMILAATPEPGTWVLFATGIGLIVLGRRTRKL